MKVIVILIVLGCVASALSENKVKNPRLDLKWHAPEPKPLQDWKAKPAAEPDPRADPSGVNLGVEKRPTIYDNGNLKIQGVGGADRNFGGQGDGAWNAKVGGRVEYSWGRGR
uniref:Uncharacterized protein n=1 Tax=Lygus hesperus TaxID=30085 RepID=A0A146KPX6_LYGHE